MPSVLEMALVSTKGIVLFSDLSKVAMSRISPFYESITRMAIGDNLSLALDTTKTIVASRISNGAVLITVTDKKVGIILTKMGGVADKFGRLLDELIVAEESKTATGLPPKGAPAITAPSPSPPEPVEEEVEPSVPVVEEVQPPAPIVEKVQPPPAPPRRPPEARRKAVEPPTTITEEAKEVAKEPEAKKEEVVGVYTSLDAYTILEAVPKPKVEGTTLDGEMIKFVRLVDGSKSVDVVAKEANVKLDRALKKLGLLIQEGILRLKYDDPVYNVVPKMAGKLDSELQSMAFAKADIPKLAPDVLNRIDGKKNVLTLARELDIEPEKLRDILKNLEKRKMIKL